MRDGANSDFRAMICDCNRTILNTRPRGSKLKSAASTLAMQVANSVVSGDSESGSEGSEIGLENFSTSSLSREAMWRLVGTVERSSAHPIANAICEAAKRHCGGEHSLGSVEELMNFREEPGLGVCCTVDSHEVVVGSKRWLEQRGVRVLELGTRSHRAESAELQDAPDVEVETEPGMASEVDGKAAAFATNVCLAIDGVHRATITVGDRPRVCAESCEVSRLFGKRAALPWRRCAHLIMFADMTVC